MQVNRTDTRTTELLKLMAAQTFSGYHAFQRGTVTGIDHLVIFNGKDFIIYRKVGAVTSQTGNSVVGAAREKCSRKQCQCGCDLCKLHKLPFF